jgi:hypothetical protein
MRVSSSVFQPLGWRALLLPVSLVAAACSDSDSEPSEGVGGSTGGSQASAAGRAGAGGDASSIGGTSAGGGVGGSNGGTGGTASNAGNGGTGSGAPGDGGLGGDGPNAAGLGPAPVDLGTAADFAILALAAISNVPTSIITGDLGLSPAAASYVTGFELTRDGPRWTSPEVTGSIFAADSDATTPADLTTAVGDMGTAYVDAENRANPDFLNLGDGAIGGRTLVPGLYRWTSTVTIPSAVTISGAPTDVWIFQITGDLTMAAAQQMTLSGGAQAKNIVWQVAGEVNLGSTAHAEGVILSKTAINLGAGSSIHGRLLAQTAVALQSSTVTEPAQ